MQNDLLGQGVPGDPGFRLRPQTVGEESKLYIAKDFYIYQEDFSGLAASTSATGTIRIQADSDFILQKLTYFADIATADAELLGRADLADGGCDLGGRADRRGPRRSAVSLEPVTARAGSCWWGFVIL